MGTVGSLFLDSVRFRFQAMKELGDRALAQLDDQDVRWQPDHNSNSIGTIVNHLHGNMLSRWTDFLTSDGDKPWRKRDEEFEAVGEQTCEETLRRWNEGWACLFSAIDSLTEEDLTRDVTIRGQALNVIDAIHRQVAHYGYHVGQIVYLARARCGEAWESLSIPKGQSAAYVPGKRD